MFIAWEDFVYGGLKTPQPCGWNEGSSFGGGTLLWKAGIIWNGLGGGSTYTSILYRPRTLDRITRGGLLVASINCEDL